MRQTRLHRGSGRLDDQQRQVVVRYVALTVALMVLPYAVAERLGALLAVPEHVGLEPLCPVLKAVGIERLHKPVGRKDEGIAGI